MNCSKLFFAFFFLLLSQSVFSLTTIYWLRGTDLSSEIGGEKSMLFGSAPPNSDSKETIEQLNAVRGVGEFSHWYSPPFSTGFVVSGGFFFWATEFGLRSGKAQYRLVLYEFGSVDNSNSLIAKSDWLDFKAGAQNAELLISAPYVIKAQNRLKFALEYNAFSDNTIIRLVLDSPQQFGEAVWNSPIGTKYSAFGAKNAAAVLLESCSINSIACSMDSDCNDGQEFSTDLCVDGGTCSAKCSYTACETACVTNAECIDENSLSNDLCSGIGDCTATCTNPICTVICAKNSDCSDSNPSTADECVYAGTCHSFCQNIGCSGEDCAVKEINVCGNSLCEFAEVCEADCKPEKIELLSVEEGEFFLYNESIPVFAKPIGFSGNVKVTLSGFFGEKELLDDGRAVDKKALDGIFSGEFAAAHPNKGTVAVTVKVLGEKNSAAIVKYYSIVPLLDVGLKTDKKSYFEGDKMLVTAFANSGKKPLKDGATLLIENGSQTVLEEKIFPNSFGLYNYGYKISSLDVAGEIRITVRAADEFQNTGSKTSTVFFSKGRRLNSGLEVSVLSLDKEIRKNQVQKIEVLVTDKSGKKTGGAKVKLTFSKGPSWVLEEKEEGIYVGSFKLSETVLSGEQQISVTAKKQVEGEELEGEFVEKVSVLPLSLKVFVNGLAKESYGAGDAVELKIFAVAAGRQVLVKEASLTLDGQEVLLKKENGFFSAKIIFGENSPQELRVSAADEFQNSGFVVVPIKITGYSLNYFFQKNLLLIFAALVILSASIAVSGYFTAKKEEQERLKKREKEIFKELTALQKKYFEVGFMQRQAYDKMVLKYENELKEIKKKLGGAK